MYKNPTSLLSLSHTHTIHIHVCIKNLLVFLPNSSIPLHQSMHLYDIYELFALTLWIYNIVLNHYNKKWKNKIPFVVNLLNKSWGTHINIAGEQFNFTFNFLGAEDWHIPYQRFATLSAWKPNWALQEQYKTILSILKQTTVRGQYILYFNLVFPFCHFTFLVL